jgi:metallo-beta-lactamase class B
VPAGKGRFATGAAPAINAAFLTGNMRMSLTRRSLFGCACCAGIVGPAGLSAATDPDLPQLLELGTPNMSRIGRSVWVVRIAPGVWLYTCTATIGGGIVYPANGLVIERKQGSVLIDTGWHPAQADILLRWAAGAIPPVNLSVVTHFHADRTGGIAAVRAAGIDVVAHPLTCALAASHGMPVPDALPAFHGHAASFGPEMELHFPGAGHSPDNIVVWAPQSRVLFGGCFLKSVTSDGLGYVNDAVLADWPASLRGVQARYPAPACIIPGHGSIAGDPIAATASLLRKG